MSRLFSLLVLVATTSTFAADKYTADSKVQPLKISCGVSVQAVEAGFVSSSVLRDPITVPGSIEAHHAYNTLYIPVWTTTQVVPLGLGYTLRLEIKGRELQPQGDFLNEQPSLTVGASLLRNAEVVSMAGVKSEEVLKGFNYGTSVRENLISTEMRLYNSLVSNALGGVSALGNIAMAVAKSGKVNELKEKFGTSEGLLTDVHLRCQMPVNWVFEGN